MEQMASARSASRLQVMLIASGALAVVASLPHVPGLARLSWQKIVNLRSPFWDFEVEIVYSAIAHLALGIGFVIAGSVVEQAVSTNARWLRWLVLVAGLAVVGEFVLHQAIAHHLVGFAAPQANLMADLRPDRLRSDVISYVWAGIRVAFLAYLYVTVRRVSGARRLATSASGTR
jgi:hypothetical protein